MPRWLTPIFGSDRFMPHGSCYLWEPGLVQLHLWSDVAIGLAYYAIPPALLYLVVKARREARERPEVVPTLPYDWIFVAFGTFIIACGTTHFVEAWTIWTPAYWFSGGVKLVTAVASIATAAAMPPLVPRALQMLRDAGEASARRRELEEAHGELERLYDRLQKMERLRSRFFANVSHELRTPLSLILGPVERMRSRENLSDADRRDLDVVLRNARNLSGQVDDLLALARMDAGRLELDVTPVDLVALVREAAAHFESVAAERAISLDVDVPERVPGEVDREKLQRVVLNLLSNAVKYSPEGGTVRCRLEVDADAPSAETVGSGDPIRGTVRIVVTDNGPGVDAERREAIFERFERLEDEPGGRFGGSGLGLAIVKEFVELHQGRVDVDDAPEGGARFTVILPASAVGLDVIDSTATAPTAGTDAAPPPPAGRSDDPGEAVGAPEAPSSEPERQRPATGERDDDGGDRPRVLVVEDHRDMAWHIGEVLRDEYDVRFAADGAEGLEKALQSPPDLIVSDVMMPEMSGDRMVRRLREHESMASIPILLLTARADEELRSDLLGRGVQDYVAKPVEVAELQARVRNLVSMKRSRDLLRQEVESQEEDLEALVREASRRRRELARALHDRDVLLKEVHHRVKGSLQTVSSLLRLQARDLQDEAAREVLERSRDRVHAVAMLHERLYRTDNLEAVEFNRYVRGLVGELSDAWSPEDDAVRLRLPQEEILLSVDVAVPCGLIVYELTSNALRHAFRPGESGEVRVDVEQDADRLVLVVADDGRGLPPEVDPHAPDRLGLQIVQALTRQLEGELRVDRKGGTEFRISLPRSGGEG